MDSVYKNVKAAVSRNKAPDGSYTDAMRALHSWLTRRDPISSEYAITFRIRDDEFQKEVVEALILADADPVDVCEHFKIPEVSYTAYKELFFDTSKFTTYLDKISYVETYDANPNGKELKLRALNMGPEFIFFTYGNVVPKTQHQQALVQRMFMASAYKAMSVNYSSIGSDKNKAALEHAKFMVKAYEALQKVTDSTPDEAASLTRILINKGLQNGVEVTIGAVRSEDIV